MSNPVDLITEPADWLVEMICPDCDWFGMRDDCKQNSCPVCGARVRKDKK